MTTGPLQGNMQSYVYDSRNRLQSAGGVSYGYNAENMRTSVTTDGNTIRYVINPNAALSQVLIETDADGNPLAYYVYGLGLLGREDASGAYQSYHYDRCGSTVALTALDGTITDTYEYGPYGEQIGHEGATEQPFRYNGRDGVMTDANGLYHMRARYYSPDIKRFINRDVVTGTISDTPTLNRYAYVNGNPISYIDPFGLSRDGDSLMLRDGDMLLDLVPGVGALKGFQQAFTGVNLVTGEKLSVGQRWMEGIGSTIGLIPIPGSKAIGKYGVEGAVALGKKAKGWFGKGAGELAEESLIKRFLPDGKVVKDISVLPGKDGMLIPTRLTPDEMEYLTKEYGVEFAQVYHAGSGKNGGGGYYKLYSGTVNRVQVPLGPDVRLISHTHPGGTPLASPQDRNLMNYLEMSGSPQRVSQIVPVGKKPVNFTKDGTR